MHQKDPYGMIDSRSAILLYINNYTHTYIAIPSNVLGYLRNPSLCYYKSYVFTMR